MTTETYILPEHWASALINADFSGLEDSDIAEIEAFENNNKEDNCRFCCVGCSEEPFFAHSNDATKLGGNVLEYTFDTSPL